MKTWITFYGEPFIQNLQNTCIYRSILEFGHAGKAVIQCITLDLWSGYKTTPTSSIGIAAGLLLLCLARLWAMGRTLSPYLSLHLALPSCVILSANCPTWSHLIWFSPPRPESPPPSLGPRFSHLANTACIFGVRGSVAFCVAMALTVPQFLP